MRKHALIIRGIFLGTVCSFFMLASVASAQFDPLVFGTSLSIGADPQYPQPGQTVHLTASGIGIDFDTSTITWRAGGKTVAQGTGVTSVDVVAGALGSELPIELAVDTGSGTPRSTQAVIAPSELDVLISSDAYVPPFYQGRALPSVGTNLIVQTMAHLQRADGTVIPDSAIIYTWKRSGEVLGTLSGRGKSSAVIPVVHLFKNEAVTVNAVSVDGTRSAETTVFIPTTDPVLDLYEDHPLYGILYNNALGASASMPESEMAFAAVPYFAQTTNPNASALSYAWRVNDTKVSSSATTPSEITINADNSTGQAAVALEVTHATNYFMDATGRWNITLSSNTPQQDAFHTTTQ